MLIDDDDVRYRPTISKGHYLQRAALLGDSSPWR